MRVQPREVEMNALHGRHGIFIRRIQRLLTATEVTLQDITRFD